MLTFCQWYESFYEKDDDMISLDEYEVARFFQIRGVLESTIAIIVDFAGLPLSSETFYPPEQEFQVLCLAEFLREIGLPFDPQNEAMLSCITKGWLHMEEDRDGSFRCYFPTAFHSRYECLSIWT
jgi:hypothetical protein